MFYSSKEINCGLLFQADVSTCSLEMTLADRSLIIEDLTVYQTLTLLILNSREEIKPRELAIKFDLQKDEIIHELSGLLYNSIPILIKTPADGDLEDNSTLKVNTGISTMKNYIKISPFKKIEQVCAAKPETRQLGV
jgi:hypothetical protein